MQDKNVNKRERNAKILGTVLLALYGAYAVISCIFQFTRGKDGLLDGFLTLAVCGVFCAIIGFSFFGKWAAFLRKIHRTETADALDAEYQNAIAPPKKAVKIKLKPKRNDLIASVAVLLIGLGAAVACWYFAARGFAKLNAPYFIKTEAIFRQVGEKAFYEFYDLNGNFVQTPASITISGITFESGFTTTIYYHSLHPEVIRLATMSVVLCGAGIFAAALGVLVCMHQLDIGLNYLLPFPAAVIFISVPVCFEISIANLTGYPFFRLLVGGTVIYACNGMITLAIYFLCVGVRNIVKRVKGYAV